MKRLRYFCAITILTSALTLSAFAGTIECGVVAPPPPQQSAVMGDIHCGVTATCATPGAEIVVIDPVTGLALNILQSLLSLF